MRVSLKVSSLKSQTSNRLIMVLVITKPRVAAANTAQDTCSVQVTVQVILVVCQARRLNSGGVAVGVDSAKCSLRLVLVILSISGSWHREEGSIHHWLVLGVRSRGVTGEVGESLEETGGLRELGNLVEGY